MSEQETQNQDFAQALAEFEQEGGGTVEQRKDPAVGDKVQGRIVSITDDNAFVDVGAKAEGVIEAAQLKDAEGNLTVNVGDTVDVVVSAIGPETGSLVLRRKAAGGRRGGGHQQQQEIAAELRQAFEGGLPVEGM